MADPDQSEHSQYRPFFYPYSAYGCPPAFQAAAAAGRENSTVTPITTTTNNYVNLSVPYVEQCLQCLNSKSNQPRQEVRISNIHFEEPVSSLF